MTRRLGPYAPLSATYAQDDAIIRAGEAAELLFVRGMAWCGQAHSDGFMTEAQVLTYVGAGLAKVADRIAQLVEVGLWLIEEGGYRIRSWLRWNRSEDEIEAARAADRDRKAKADGPSKPPPSRSKARPAAKPKPSQPAEARDDVDTVLRETAVALQSTAAALARNSTAVAAALDGHWPVDVLVLHLSAALPDKIETASGLMRTRLEVLPERPSACGCLGCAGWRATAEAADRAVRDAADAEQADAAAAVQAAAWAARQDEIERESAERHAKVDAITGKIGEDLAMALFRAEAGPTRLPTPNARRATLGLIYEAAGWDVEAIRERAESCAELARQVVA